MNYNFRKKELQMDPGVYWVQVNQQVSLWDSSLNVLAFHVLKHHSFIFSNEEINATIEDNSEETGLMQTKDIDEVMQLI